MRLDRIRRASQGFRGLHRAHRTLGPSQGDIGLGNIAYGFIRLQSLEVINKALPRYSYAVFLNILYPVLSLFLSPSHRSSSRFGPLRLTMFCGFRQFLLPGLIGYFFWAVHL